MAAALGQIGIAQRVDYLDGRDQWKGATVEMECVCHGPLDRVGRFQNFKRIEPRVACQLYSRRLVRKHWPLRNVSLFAYSPFV